MASLSFRVPDSLYDELEQLADDEDVSVSEIARESILDGVGLRTGRPVVMPDGGATMVQQVARIDARNQYLLLGVMAVLGFQYAQQLLEGTAQLVAYAALGVIAAGTLALWWRQA
jgi:hypothetical protein